MKLSEIRKNVFHLQFDNQYSVASTFLRLQEYYESPFEEIRGKFFTLEEYMDVYARENGNFTYTSDWSGFNVPDWIVRDFFKLFWYDLLMKEKLLYKTISPLLAKNEKFYLIATFDEYDLSHEISHAYFYLYEEYANLMTQLVEDWKHTKRFGEILVQKGYTRSVLNDEIQAYLSTGERDFLVNVMHLDRRWIVPISFQKTFKLFDNKYSSINRGKK